MLNWNDVIRFANHGNPEPDRRVVKSEEEWRSLLTPGQYRITREKGTESAFSSEMCSLFEPGCYSCVCCNTLLFDAGEKFESGTGWPSFTQPVNANVIAYHKDSTRGMQRVETVCNTCDAHLGHVLDGDRVRRAADGRAQPSHVGRERHRQQDRRAVPLRVDARLQDKPADDQQAARAAQ